MRESAHSVLPGYLSRQFMYLHVVYFGVLLPWRAVARHRRRPAAEAGPPPRIPFAAAVLMTVRPGALSLVVAWATGVRIFAARWPSASDFGLAVLAFAGLVLISLPSWRRAVTTKPRHIARWLPTNRNEQLLWAALCVMIGVAEEITWRGVQFALLLRLLGWWPGAVLVCALMFGVIHVSQGRRWVVGAAATALLLHGLVWATQSLYPAMMVHTAINITASLYLARYWPVDPSGQRSPLT
jgi:membrane protease YdiL (CAAX protease family)